MNYVDRQEAEERAYEEACLKWLASMTPAERKKAIEKGVVRVSHEHGKEVLLIAQSPEYIGRDVCRDGDAADLFKDTLRLSEPPDTECHALPEMLAERFGLDLDQAREIALWHMERVRRQAEAVNSRLLRRVIGYFIQPGNLLIRAHALAHAARMATISGFSSLRQSAEACKVSAEAVRKVAWKWVELLGLPPLDGCKSEEARRRYSEDKKTNHWRHQKCTKEHLPPQEQMRL